MPRNRRDVDREEKVDQILDAAAHALRTGGYDALSFSSLAADLGLARNALYWYFPTKDDLFVAAAARIFTAALSNPPVKAGYLRRIAWGVDQLAELQPLTLALHDRARHSKAAAELNEAVQEEICERLRQVLRDHVEPDRLDGVAQTIVVFVQGLLTTPLAAKERNRRLQFLLDQLVP